MPLDFRVTVTPPNLGGVLVRDCSADIIGLQYEDTPSGCGAGKLTLGIFREDVTSRGYYEQFNIVEIFTGDMRLTTACAAGATKVYLDTTEPLDPAQGEDNQVLYFWDGVNLTMFCTVLSIGSDSGGAYATISAPAAVAGNPGSLPAYGAGTIVGRRRYTGRVALVSSTESRSPNVSVSLVGLTVAWTQATGSVSVSAAANVDVGTALFEVLNQFQSTHWPFFTLSAGNFPTTGYTYADTLTTVSMDRFIADALGAIPNADLYVVRVGHDLTPRLVHAYTSSSNTYTYNRVLAQGVTNFEAQQVEIDDQNISSVYNAIQVTGSSAVVSSQPVTVQVTDPASIAALGFQIDGTPTSNTAISTTAAAASYGAGLLAQNSLAAAANSVLVWTDDDNPTALYSGGPIRGDVIRALACLTITNFDKTGIVTNSVPDSPIQYGTGIDALWTIVTGTATVAPEGAPDGEGAWVMPAAGGGDVYSPPFAVAPGQVFTFDAFVDTTNVTGGLGTCTINVCSSIGGAGFATTVITSIAAGRPAANTFTVPAGVTQIYFQFYLAAHSGSAGNVYFSQPNVVRGSSIRPYVQNAASPSIYGISSSVVTTIDLKTQTSKQEAQFAAIEPDWSAYVALKQNAAVTALLANRTTPLSIDRFCVSANARNFSTSTSSLVLGMPALLALFTSGSALVSVPATNLTLAASQTNWVWLEPSGSSSYAYLIQQTPTTVNNAILIGYFTCSSGGIIGANFVAPVGVFQVGVGNVNVAANLPAPTWSAYTCVNGAAISGLAAAVDAVVGLNNVPQDGSVYGVMFYYRQSTSAGGSGTWIPDEGQNLAIASGSTVPTSAQNASFEYDLNNGTTYDFAIGYVGLGGYGPLAIFQSSFTAAAIGIPTSYQLGTLATPVVATSPAPGAAPAGTNNGIAAAEHVTFTLSNQPTDGSLSRISLWFRQTGTTNWSYAGSIAAVGVGTTSPPASAAYSFTFTDLTNGVGYGFGVSYENAQGGDGPVVFVVAGAAQLVQVTTQYLVAGASPQPTFASSPAPSAASAPTLQGLAARVGVAFTVNNQPTDGSLSQIGCYYRLTGTDWSKAFAIPSAPLAAPLSATSTYYFEIGDVTAGVAMDFGCTYENAQGGEGPVATIITNYLPAPIAIANSYMLGTLATPTFSGISSLAYGSTGLTATTALNFTITNQPTDGSLSRISLYVAPHGSGNYGYVGSLPAVGASSSTPPASGTYSNVQVPNLVNGLSYDFAVALENAQGGEGAITFLTTSTAALVAITTQYLVGGTPVTPTVTANGAGIASAPTLPGVTGRVALSFSCTNQPTDGSFSGVVVYMKQHSAGTAAFSAQFFVPSTSLATPSATGAYYVELPDVTAGVALDFGIAYENTQGGQGAIASPSFMQNFTPQAIAIANAYMLGGTSITPSVSSVSVTNGTSGNGVNADVVVAFTATNQPADGSLSRVQLWVRASGVGGSNTIGGSGFAWSPYGSQPAVGVGTASPPASGMYSFSLADLTNGASYDFGCSYENAQGGESTIGVISSAFAAQALNIQPSATTFQNLLTGGFPGLLIDEVTGALVMPVSGAGIYPSTLNAVLPLGTNPPSGNVPGQPVTFKMQFELTSTSTSMAVSANALTNGVAGTGAFTNGYSVIYVASPTSAYITLYKKVAGTLVAMCARQAGYPASSVYSGGPIVYPAVPAIPASDGNLHELTLTIASGFGGVVPSTGVTITVALDGVVIMTFTESTTSAAITSTSYAPLFSGGAIGGVPPFTSGTCGPGTNGYALVYLDPTGLEITSAATAFSESNSAQIQSLVKTQAQQLALASPTALATQSVARESIVGSTGEGINLLFNPTGVRGLTNWTAYNGVGGTSTIYTDQGYGGRFVFIIPAATYAAANEILQLYQTFAGSTVLGPNTTYTVSGWCEVDLIGTAALVSISIAGISGTSGTTNWQTGATGSQFFKFTFTTGSSTSGAYLQIVIYSGNKTATETIVEFYKLMVEQGGVATAYDDSQSAAVVTQTHSASGQIIAGLSTSTALVGQSSILPAATSFSISCIPSSSHTSYGPNGSPTPAATYSVIAISWAAWTVQYPSGVTTGPFPAYSGNVYVAGFPFEITTPLQPSTSYYVTVYGTYGNGSVTTAFTTSSLSQAEAATLFADGEITLVVNQGPITTPAKPTSGATSGGGYVPPTNTCPAVGQIMQTQRGFVPAEELVVGDELLDWDAGVYNRVERVVRVPSTIYSVEIAGETFRVDEQHLWAWPKGWWPMHSLSVGDVVCDAEGGVLRVDAVENLGPGDYIAITCERQRFRMGRAVAHNISTNQAL